MCLLAQACWASLLASQCHTAQRLMQQLQRRRGTTAAYTVQVELRELRQGILQDLEKADPVRLASQPSAIAQAMPQAMHCSADDPGIMHQDALCCFIGVPELLLSKQSADQPALWGASSLAAPRRGSPCS